MEFAWNPDKAAANHNMNLPTNALALNPAADLADELNDELRPEYNASLLITAMRGKHLAEYRAGNNLVLLAPDVAAVFPDAEAVNKVLRALINAMPPVAHVKTGPQTS